MSKERLGFDAKKEMEHLKNIVNKDDSLTISSRFVKYLIEQAKRVETLEKREEVRKMGAEANSKYYGKIEQQNKRYREVMKSSLSEIKYSLYSHKSMNVKEHYLKNAERFLSEALEDNNHV